MFDLIIYLLFSIIVFNKLKQDNFILKGFSLFITINVMFTIINYYFHINISYYFIIQSIILYYILLCKINSNINNQQINKKFISIIFYKPKTLKQHILSLLGLSYSSSGLIIYDNKQDKYFIYQMRYENKTLQKRELLDHNYLNKYLIINTDIQNRCFNVELETKLLQQKARQPKTLFLRYNCLRSLRYVLNLSDKFYYSGEIFPCIYLLKLKLKGIYERKI